ncbi:MAG: SAM-dependent methyltransferase [Verrucomicrobia bacterium]|nr:SAM-dependent methyltransferase [Verrucomicrobiota bacterium]
MDGECPEQVPDVTRESPELRELLTAVIAREGGVIPFARFMDLALYAPGLGYYEREARTVGRAGDFQTSVSVGPLLGDLLGFECARWLSFLEGRGDDPLDLVEAGAHDGRLAADLLAWFQRWRPGMFSRLRLWLVEPSARRRTWQQTTLERWKDRVHWVAALDALLMQTGGIRGVFYSNELLDAFPVHRLVWRRPSGNWEELGVAFDADGGLVWRPLPPARITDAAADLARLAALPSELRAVLPDGFTVDVCPAADAWWRAAAGTLRAGVLMALDYGFGEDAPLRPEHPAGTLRGYRDHRVHADDLADPGASDLTASVEFGRIAAAGESVGLRTVVRVSQRRWLTELFEATLASGAEFAPWDSARVRQFQTLTHPEHLGRRFQVLVQQRGMDPARMGHFEHSLPSAEGLPSAGPA